MNATKEMYINISDDLKEPCYLVQEKMNQVVIES